MRFMQSRNKKLYNLQFQPQVQQRELRPRVNLRLPARYQLKSVELHRPVNFKDAKACHLKDMWSKAVQEELAANNNNNQSWATVLRPKNKKVIGSTWIFVIQSSKNGQSNRFKELSTKVWH